MRPFLALLVLACAARAGVHYTASGIFDPSVPTSFFTAPSQSWSIAFDTDLNPVPIDSTPTSFIIPLTNFTYALNGGVTGLIPLDITFYDISDLGGYILRFSPGNEFSFVAPQMFSGPTSAPTMLLGAFVAESHVEDYLLVDDVKSQSLAGTVLYATPEPGTLTLGGAAILAFWIARRRRSATLD